MKKEKGAISIFVLIALLFMSAYLIISFASNINKSKVVIQQKEIIGSIYSKQVEDINEKYNSLTALPIINELPDTIITNVTPIADPYVNYDSIGGVTEYTALENNFSTMQEIVDYVVENNKYGDIEVFLKANGNNGKTAELTKKISFIEPTAPIINNLPNPIITNVTTIEDSYVQYGILGGTTKYVAFDKEFSSLNEVIEYVIANNRYEKVDITIIANDNNTKSSESTQNIEFIRGMKVSNESELTTAFATTGNLYIYVVNNIACSNTITTNNINHKIDLNNYTISYTKQNESFSFITLESNANLTVLDSSESKNGTIAAILSDETSYSDGKDRSNTICTIQNKGTLTIESGKISADNVQKLLEKNYSTNVDNTSITINNSGTVNLNGGTVYCNIWTKGCTYWGTRRATSNARGIINAGTVNLNSGNITVNSEASMGRPSGATVYGKTYAYAYGVENSGTLNQNGNVTFTVTVNAHIGGTYTTGSDSAEIK